MDVASQSVNCLEMKQVEEKHFVDCFTPQQCVGAFRLPDAGRDTWDLAGVQGDRPSASPGVPADRWAA